MPVCFHGRGRVRCGWGCALRFLAAWVDVILSCSFLLLLSYIVANVELLDVVRHDELLSDFFSRISISPLMRMPISEEPSIIFSYNSVPSMSVNTLAAFSRSACVASGFWRSCRRRQSRQSCCPKPVACPRRPLPVRRPRIPVPPAVCS